MEYQQLPALLVDPLSEAGSSQQFGCDGGIFAFGDIPGDDLVPPARWPRPGRGCLAPALHLLGKQAPLTAVGAQLDGIKPT